GVVETNGRGRVVVVAIEGDS
ncbi:hypothetical protein Tco_0082530, partial [Tanacetum coccineum]